MIEAFRIGVAMNLEGNLAAQLPPIAQAMRDLASVSRGLTADMKSLASSATSFAKAMSGLGTAASEMKAFADSVLKAREAWGAGFPNPPRGGVGGGGGGGGGRGPSYRPNDPRNPRWNGIYGGNDGAVVPYEDPRMGLGPTGPNFRTGAAAPDENFNGGKIPLNYRPQPGSPASRSHNHDLLVGGYAAEAAGTGILRSIGHAVHIAMQPEEIKALLRANRDITPEMADQLYEEAYKATQSAPGTTLGGNMEAGRDIYRVVGSLPEAIKVLPAFARLAAVLKLTDEKTGGKGDPAFAAAKAMEILGRLTTEETDPNTGEKRAAIDPEKLPQYLQAIASTSFVEGTTPQDYLNFARQARIGGMQSNDEFIFKKIPAMMQVLGARRTGTALNSLSQLFQGNKLTQKSLGALYEAGLLAEGSRHVRHVAATKHRPEHDIVTYDDAGVFELETLKQDAAKWSSEAEKTLEKGDATHAPMTRDQIIGVMQKLQRNTVAGFLADMIANEAAIERTAKNIGKTGPDGRGDLLDQQLAMNPAAHLNQMTAAWQNMLTLWGGPLVEPAVHLMDMTTGALNGLGAWAHNNKDIAKVIGEAATGLAALSAAIGSIAIAVYAGGAIKRVLDGGTAPPTPGGGPGGMPGIRPPLGPGGLLKGVWKGGVTGILMTAAEAGIEAALDHYAPGWLHPGGAAGDAFLADQDYDVRQTTLGRLLHGDLFSGGPPKPEGYDQRHPNGRHWDWLHGFQDNAGPGGVGPQSANAPPITLQGKVMLDGNAIGTFVAGKMLAGAVAQPASPLNYDFRATPLPPALSGGTT